MINGICTVHHKNYANVSRLAMLLWLGSGEVYPYHLMFIYLTLRHSYYCYSAVNQTWDIPRLELLTLKGFEQIDFSSMLRQSEPSSLLKAFFCWKLINVINANPRLIDQVHPLRTDNKATTGRGTNSIFTARIVSVTTLSQAIVSKGSRWKQTAK